MDDQQLDEKAIFNAALCLESVDDRQNYLRAACGSRPEILERVSLLLQIEAEPTSFLETPAAGVVATLAMSPPSERVGTTIGRYKLRELLGEGGMGSVYVAEQTEPVRRKVALKIIKPGMDSRQVISRFEAERQALALMDHPNIARVLDAGTTDKGLPYFVMELVKGAPITEHCDLQKLGIRERLELFVQVCNAVQHAHQKGIIHRDLKPSNIIVAIHDTLPVVKVIDFGVAKAIGQQLSENTLYTAFSQMVGTPLYMSPEQAGQSSLDIDTRSDIYSLGVLLYELLTGNTPFDRVTLKQAGYDEMRRIIREVDPPKPSARISTLKAADQSTIAQQHRVEPSKFSQLLRGELDWIVMKAIEKDRNRRYETAIGLARDIDRYLNDQPVEACPPSTAYRLKKLFRRNKASVLATSLVVLAMLVAAGMSVMLGIRESQAAQRRLFVQRGINDVLTEVARLRGQTSTTTLGNQTALTLAREQIQRAQALVDTGDADATVIAQVRQLASDLDLEQRDSQLLAALDAAWLTEPNLDWDRRFANKKSVQHLRDALTADGLVIGRELPQTVASQIKNRRERVRSEIVAALYEWHSLRASPIGVVLKDSPDSGLVTYVSPESPSGSKGGLEKDDRIVGIGQGSGASVTSTSGMTVVQIMQLLHGEPGTIVRLEVLPKAAKESRTVEVQRDTSAAWLWAVIQATDLDPWRQSVRIACELDDESLRRAELEKLIATVDFSGQPVRFLNQVGAELVRAKSIDQATAFMKQVWEKHPGDIATNISLAICLRRNKPPQIEDGLRYYTAAIALRPDSGVLRNMRGVVFNALGKHDESFADYSEAVRLDQNFAVAHSNLGNELSKQGKLDEAVKEHREAIRLEPDNAMAYNNLGITLRHQGKLQEAVDVLRTSIRFKQDMPHAHANLSIALMQLGQFEEAFREQREAIRLKPDFPGAINLLAWHLATCPDPKWRDPAKALELAMRAVQSAPENASFKNTLGIAQYRNGHWEATVKVLEETIELSAEGFSFSGFFLAMAHWQLGEKLKARTWYDKSVEWMNQNAPEDEELLRFRAEAAGLLGIEDGLNSIQESSPAPDAN